MNFSFELQGAAMTGNITPDMMNSMAAAFGMFFGGLGIVWISAMIAIAILMIISRRRVFQKAGFPGRGIFIPFYNRYLMFKVGGRSGWNFLWIFIPPVFAILMIINYFKIAKNFGKHRTFGLGLRLVKIVFVPILAFDKSKYMKKTTPAKPVAKIEAKPIAKPIAKKVIAKKPAAKKPAAKKPAAKAPAKKVKTIAKKK